MHAFNPSIQEAKKGKSLEFDTSLVYRVSYRTERASERETLSQQGKKSLAVVAHAFNPNTGEEEARRLASLVYRVRSRTGRATQ